MKISIEREDKFGRYVFEFKTKKVTFHKFLQDYVFRDPKLFNDWMQSFVKEIQLERDQ